MKPFAACSATLIGAMALSAMMLGCSEESDEVSDDQIRSEFQTEVWRVAEYTVRGLVVALPQGDDEMMVRHEAIPEFRGPDELGMDVMDMPFPFAEGVSIDGIEVGDKLSLTFSVDYEEGWSPVEYRVIRYEKLPADTELDFTRLPRDEDGAE